MVAVLLAAVLLGACTGEEPQPDATGSDGAPTDAVPTAAPTPSPSPVAAGPELAPPPGGQASLWLDTIGIPVVAAVRTSTPLAGLADVPAGERSDVCRQVAVDLDGIAAPQVLTGLAITADAETATLLVGDLQAKGDLLAACGTAGPELEALIAEVEHTHAVAVAWLGVLGGGG